MYDSIPTFPPQQLLLATDMSVHGDRPLDRAKQLALEWQAHLTVLMVRELPGTPEEVSSWFDGSKVVHPFERQARFDLAEEFSGTGVIPALRVKRGDVSDGILDAAASPVHGLVIIGASRSETVGQLLLGSTATRLAQELAQPLLVVRQRSRGPYVRILVASDFGKASQRALEMAAGLFPGRQISLFHCIDDYPGAPADAVAAAVAGCERFLDGCALPAGTRERIDVKIGQGPLTGAMTSHVRDHATELVVLGVRQRSALSRVFMGSQSDELLRQLPCDTLLVRAMEGSADD